MAGDVPRPVGGGLSEPGPGDVSGLYDRWSGTYDEDENRTRDLAARVLRRAVDPGPGEDVVEPGCGTGSNTAWLAVRAASVVGLDLSRGMLGRARKKLGSERARLVRHDITEGLPLRDACADLVVVALVLEHLPEVAGAMAEAARILRVGGRVFVCEYHPYRQLAGGQARFRDESASEEIRVPAYLHTLSEHVGAGLDAGLRLTGLDEWWHDADPEGGPPRLVSLSWRKADGAR